MKRQQMTFFVSFWDAIVGLPKKDQLSLFRAVISYGLFGTHEEALSKSALSLFSLILPVLDKSRKKAANRKQTENKTETNEEQTVNDKEREKERDKEYEREYDKEQNENTAPFSGKPFTAFWDAYPKKIDREGAWEAWKALNPSPDTARQILESLEAWKKSSQWTQETDRFIPGAANFLTKGHWQYSPPPAKSNIPRGANGDLGQAELENIRKLMEESP